MSIYTASDITGLTSDGLLGLSPKFISNTDATSGELYVNSLLKSGAIKKAVFGLYLATTKS